MQQSGYKGFSPSNINRSNDLSNKFDKSREGQSLSCGVWRLGEEMSLLAMNTKIVDILIQNGKL